MTLYITEVTSHTPPEPADPNFNPRVFSDEDEDNGKLIYPMNLDGFISLAPLLKM